MNCELKEELEIITKALNENSEKDIESYKDFHVGEFIERPNQCGCFRRGGKWYIYQIDEKNYCTFCGPFSSSGIIYACAKVLHISSNYKKYRFSQEELEIYIHNHFHSFEEIDKNIKE